METIGYIVIFIITFLQGIYNYTGCV